MSSRAAQLAIELTEKGASSVAGGFDDVTSSANRMGDTVEAAGKQAKSAGDRMDSAAGGADEMASKGSQAAGAMGGLGDLIGGKFGAAMATGGIGLQAMADSGDLLNAALENSVVANVRAKAGVVAKTIADKAAAGATRTMTIAQKALNLAQRASPIGLIITAVLILGGLFVLLYKRSDKFREIVDKAMKVAKAGVSAVVKGFQAFGAAVLKVMQFVARIVGLYVKVYITAFKLGFTVAKAAWQGIQNAVSTAVGFVTDKVAAMRDKLAGVWAAIRSKASGAFHAIISPVQTVIDLVESLLDKISKIHLPHVDVNPFSKAGAGPSTGGSIDNSTTISFTVNITGDATADQAATFMRTVDRQLRSLGRQPVFS